MKKLTIIAALFLLCSCGPSAAELEKRCTDILNNPDMELYYGKPNIDGYRKAVEDNKEDPKALETLYNKLQDKQADAHAAITVERLKNQ